MRHMPLSMTELNKNIRENEVWAAIKQQQRKPLKNKESLRRALLKNSQEPVVPFLTSYFNHLFNNSLFPKQRSKALLVSIHKNGSINDPDNYRGLSLPSILSKRYTYVLNKQLERAERQGKLVEEQGGFRMGRLTVHHIFVIILMVEKALAKSEGKLCVAFIEFRKTYDSVNKNIVGCLAGGGGVGRLAGC